MIINENGLSTADPTIELIEQHMVGFFFGEGDLGKLPAGFSPAGENNRSLQATESRLTRDAPFAPLHLLLASEVKTIRS